jgi:undecaprenyl phosphate-alpha-L-ara4FN deformylase
MQIGLRIDVDTLRGTRLGVPTLCRILAARGIRATYFFSVGPDNMGRHLWRLLRPQFLIKMLRSNAPGLYGWDILLRGTFWPGPIIGQHAADAIRGAATDGHEIGVHAWDHHAWQAATDHATATTVHGWTERAMNLLTDITGAAPTCAAAPGWRCTDTILRERERFPFRFNSDCRGSTAFRPVVDHTPLSQPQIPNTLPTYDEIIGQNGITHENYNDYMLGQLRPDALNVLTIHAEAEGIVCAELFERFVGRAVANGWSFVPLGELVPPVSELPEGAIVKQVIPGREGWVGVQAPAV